MKKFLKNYSLSFVLLILFSLSLTGHIVFKWREFSHEQEKHGRSVEVQQFIDSYASSTLENWQSEFLQLFVFVVITSFFIHKGSPESKDGDEEVVRRLDRIEKMLREK